MHEFICFNQNIERAGDSSVSAVSSAALYGRGIFTTVAIYGKNPFLWEKHWRRLNENAHKLRIDLSAFTEEIIKASLFELTEKNNFIDGRARITFFDEAAGKIWNFPNSKQTSFLITTADLREFKENFRVSISPYPINSSSPLANIKSCNYLENLIAHEEAQRRGFDEAIRINERGEIVSACLANIFWLKNEKLFTTPLAAGCLAGTMRGFLSEKRAAAEVAANLNILESADAIFLTSAGIGIRQISEFSGRTFTRKFEEITRIVDFRS